MANFDVTIADIRSRTGLSKLDTTSRPTQSDIEAWIGTHYADLCSHLQGSGIYPSTLISGVNGYAVARTYVISMTSAYTLQAYYGDDRGEARIKMLMEEGTSIKKRPMRDWGSSRPDPGSGTTASGMISEINPPIAALGSNGNGRC